MLKILAVGDLVGEGGVKKLKELLPKIREEESKKLMDALLT